jgi:acetyl esterase
VSVDPAIAALFAQLPAGDPELERQTPVAERRAAIEAGFAEMMLSLPARPTFDDVTVEETTVPGHGRDIPVRVFRPAGGPGALPALLYLFGGGYWMRSYNSPDIVAACRQIAGQAGVVVVEIDYALAPENPYPAAVDEGWTVLEWMASRPDLDATRLAVGGQSSGGGLAAALAIRARDAGGPALALQVLEVPAVDLALETDLEALAEITSFYLPPGMTADDPRVSPGRTGDLAGLPPTLIVNAENDLLRESGELFASRLRDAGVTVVSTTYGGAVHNSPGLAAISAGSRAWREQVAWAVGTLHSPGGALS